MNSQPSRFRCRTHAEVAVTWRGTGCPFCDKSMPAAARRAAKRRQRDAERNPLPEWVTQ